MRNYGAKLSVKLGAIMKYKLVLYINGLGSTSKLAIRNLQQLLETNADLAQFELETVDISLHPELAEADNIIVTPTVLKKLPPPIRSLVGDMSFKEQVLTGLSIVPQDSD